MDKSFATSQSQRSKSQRKSSAGQREQFIPSTPQPETMTPPAPQSMVLPTTGTSLPAETSEGSTYLKILEDVMGKINSSGKMSEVFSQLAKKFKDEEEQLTPVGIPTGASVQTNPATAQPLVAQTTSQAPLPASEPVSLAFGRRVAAEYKKAAESSKEGGSRKERESGERIEAEAREPAEE